LNTRDISERKDAEMERSRLQDQLQQAMKMEAVGGWPAVLPTTSTTCSPSSPATLLADAFSDRIDLLMTDVVMPGMNGRNWQSGLANAIPR